jgi:hypothetical protein
LGAQPALSPSYKGRTDMLLLHCWNPLIL